MKKIIQRLFIFFIGIPALIALVVFLPAFNHLCLNIIVVIVSSLGAMEFQNILKQKNLVISPPKAVILGGLIPALTTAAVCFSLSIPFILLIFMLFISWFVLSGVFSSPEKQESYITRIAAGFSVMIYPGLFLSWIIPMAILPRPGFIITFFLLIVFLNDSAAWVAGMLFGKGNRGLIPASPNKSIAGFIAGIFASLITGITGAYFFPSAFESHFFPAIAAGIFLSFFTGLATILGDLGESVLKRSAGIKDSGVLMPGRGGILDSIDSVSLAAPIFYLAYRLLFV